MKRKTCFFIGHREVQERIYPIIIEAVKRHIEEHGVTEFIVGSHGNFDRLAARAVKEVRKERPDIKLTLLLPYHPAERSMDYPQGFTGSLYPPGLETVP